MISINRMNCGTLTITTGSAPSELGIPLYFRGNEPRASVAMLAWDEGMYEQTDLQCHLEYSTDNMSTWSDYDGHIVELDNCADNKVYFRADTETPNTTGFYIYDEAEEFAICHYFKTTGSVGAGGNIQFLLESTGTRTDVPAHGFYQMFGHASYDEMGVTVYDCATLTSAPLLSATTLATECYSGMFQCCSSLTTAPATLPATTLATYCYAGMFGGCSSLTQAPSLPATTITNGCYQYMFHNCSSLTTAPALPATTLASNCYFGMFNDCTHLASMEVSFTAWSPTNATSSWVSNAGTQASGTKTFKCPSNLPRTYDNSHIPTGWTVI